MDSKKLYDEQIEYAAELLKKPPIEPTHFYFTCPKCGYASLIPCGTDTRPDGSEPGEQIQNNTHAWISKNDRLVCPVCKSETTIDTGYCSVCGNKFI